MLCAQSSVGMINIHHYEYCNLPRHVHELLNEYGAIQSWVSKIKRNRNSTLRYTTGAVLRPTGGSSWDMAGKVISFDHVWVTQSTSNLAWKPGMVSGKRVPDGTQLTV